MLHFLHPFILGTHSISSLRYFVSMRPIYTNKRSDGAVEGDEERTEKEDVVIGTNIEKERLIY